jgi:hydrogenase nickel incorporation protein HypB
MFRAADLVIFTKLDLAAAVGFDKDKAVANVRAVNDSAAIIETSSRRADGIAPWLAWLERPRTAAEQG